MQQLGFVGWRGMVGSVLLERLCNAGDLQNVRSCFFSSSQAGEPAPNLANTDALLQDAFNLDALMAQDIILTCQGSDYTKTIYPQLRKAGWQGYWLDASSALRLSQDTCIVLDPVNQVQITQALNQGIKTFVGGNCTVSLMLMALYALFQENWIQWGSIATYQAISGSGMQAMRELLQQMYHLNTKLHTMIDDTHQDILQQVNQLNEIMHRLDFPVGHIKAPLINNLLPWIDTPQDNGQTREEWKSQVETNLILGTTQHPIAIDSTCVRIDALRCHSQAITLKLRDNIPLVDIEQRLEHQHPWMKFVENTPEATRKHLTPAAVSGTLDIAVGRVRKMTLGDCYLSVFTVGDQLLWGAAEPLRRMLKQLL